MLEILNMVAKGKAAGGNFHSFGAITLGPNTYNSGFAPVSNTPFAIGGSSDGKYLFSGTISNIHIEM